MRSIWVFLLVLYCQHSLANQLTQQQLNAWFTASKQLQPIIEKIEQDNTFQDISNPSQFAEEMASQLKHSKMNAEVSNILASNNLTIDTWAKTTEQVVFAAMAASADGNEAQIQQYKTMKQQLLDNPDLTKQQKQEMMSMFEVSDLWINQLEAVPQSDIDLVKPMLDKFNQELGWEMEN
ncbi:hypothetical protein ACVFI8_18290 [Agarivorans sp. MS3-6]